MSVEQIRVQVGELSGLLYPPLCLQEQERLSGAVGLSLDELDHSIGSCDVSQRVKPRLIYSLVSLL